MPLETPKATKSKEYARRSIEQAGTNYSDSLPEWPPPYFGFRDGNKVLLTCVRCSTFQASPEHILDCLGLSKQDLYEDPLMVLDFFESEGDHELGLTWLDMEMSNDNTGRNLTYLFYTKQSTPSHDKTSPVSASIGSQCVVCSRGFSYEIPVSETVVTYVGTPVAWESRIIDTAVAAPLTESLMMNLITLIRLTSLASELEYYSLNFLTTSTCCLCVSTDFSCNSLLNVGSSATPGLEPKASQ
ncbi:hypothetical protein TNCV_3980731 [Trichonephila clavipes]|nr:hypothetical protein TNCV_3980731 [Trichonephila clavipes]